MHATIVGNSYGTQPGLPSNAYMRLGPHCPTVLLHFSYNIIIHQVNKISIEIQRLLPSQFLPCTYLPLFVHINRPLRYTWDHLAITKKIIELATC